MRHWVKVSERETPRLGHGGVAAPIKQYREASLAGADGAVVQEINFHDPSAARHPTALQYVPRTPAGVRFFCGTNQGLRSLCSLNPWLNSPHASGVGNP